MEGELRWCLDERPVTARFDLLLRLVITRPLMISLEKATVSSAITEIMTMLVKARGHGQRPSVDREVARWRGEQIQGV